jgi:protein-L-isoaspartate(D-aspartate) O-methyltransferase
MVFIEENENLIKHLRSKGYLRSRPLEEALRKLPRHLFVPESFRRLAYRDAPLAIGYNQTISQPTTVVAMTEALNVKSGQKILEIGSGSGWQAALLSQMVGKKGYVYSIEIVAELTDFARRNIETLGINNVEIILRDGSLGLKEEAPYDRIIVTAASPKIQDTLLDQLNVGGIMVIPVGNMYLQEMMVVRKKKNGIEKRSIGNFAFVPLVGEKGFKRF